MTDPIQAAIEKAEAAVEALMLSGPIAGVPQATENRLAIVRAAIRSLAAVCIEKAAKATGNVLHPYSAEGGEAMDAIRALLPESREEAK